MVSQDCRQLFSTFIWEKLPQEIIDVRKNVIPLTYTIMDDKASDEYFFFLFFKCLQMLVSPQPNLCLISSRYEPIKSVIMRVNI
ncbi:hypothetical protein MTR_7g080590 [Medicago truncatula]|uniref:Uncharacterized protein n=1 Tax=Medicago truncatula TaxID=3880 RepID=G7KSF4_MEDTR|nr:hypothetical protein MTR_7g080590 [Medicago truncatula]